MERSVVVTGANGWIGGKVARALLADGWQVTGISRRPESARERFPEIAWAGLDAAFDEAVMHAGKVVNFAGLHPFERPWDDEGKALIRNSRVETTARVAAALGYSSAPDKVLVNPSGTWYYGECSDDIVTEDRPSTRATYLTRMHAEWEEAAFNARHSGTRVAVIRIGLGVGADGGAFVFLRQPFDNGMGIILGGRQYTPWIHIDDLTALFVRALADPAFEGAYNGSAPEPARYADVAAALAAALGKPCEVVVPEEQVRAQFGEASEILLTSCRAVPSRALAAGFTFHHPDLAETMQSVFSTKRVGV